MRLNHFIIAFIVIAILGGASGTLAGSLASSTTSEADPTLAPGNAPRSDTPAAANPNDVREAIQEIRGRVQSGEITREQAREQFERFRDQMPSPNESESAQDSTTIASLTRSGAIQEVNESRIIMTSNRGEQTVLITGTTVLSQITIGKLEDLSVGDAVSVIGQRTQDGVVARAVIQATLGLSPRAALSIGSVRSRGEQDAGSSRQGRMDRPQRTGSDLGTALVGTISVISDGGITIDTEQGPLSTSVNEQTIIPVLAPLTITALSQGQRMTVSGTTNSDGAIKADSIVVVGISDNVDRPNVGRGSPNRGP